MNMAELGRDTGAPSWLQPKRGGQTSNGVEAMALLDTFVTRDGMLSRFVRSRAVATASLDDATRPRVSQTELQKLFSRDLGLSAPRPDLTRAEQDQLCATDRIRDALYSD